MASSRREKELARQRAERQAARRAAAAAQRKKRTAVLATVFAVLLVVVGLGVGAAALSRGGGSDATASPSASGSPKPGGCTYEKAGTASRQVPLPPTEGVETKGIYRSTMTTNRGTITFKMDAGLAPCTVNSMRSLAHFGFFDKTPCWRLTAQSVFVLQCGDPTDVGTGGPGYRFADENTEGAVYKRGTVAMANNGPGTGTNGSQFFLVYKDSQLPPGYTVFGQITSGLDVLDKVAAAGSTPAGDGKPKLRVDVATLRIAKVA